MGSGAEVTDGTVDIGDMDGWKIRYNNQIPDWNYNDDDGPSDDWGTGLVITSSDNR